MIGSSSYKFDFFSHKAEKKMNDSNWVRTHKIPKMNSITPESSPHISLHLKTARTFLENFDERFKGKTTEEQVSLLKTTLSSTLDCQEKNLKLCKDQENFINELESQRDELKEAIEAKDLGLGYLNNEFKKMTVILDEKKKIINDSKKVIRRHEMKIENQNKQIKDLIKSLDENKAVIVGQNKTIKQQKQRIGKADTCILPERKILLNFLIVYQ